MAQGDYFQRQMEQKLTMQLREIQVLQTERNRYREALRQILRQDRHMSCIGCGLRNNLARAALAESFIGPGLIGDPAAPGDMP